MNVNYVKVILINNIHYAIIVMYNNKIHSQKVHKNEFYN